MMHPLIIRLYVEGKLEEEWTAHVGESGKLGEAEWEALWVLVRERLRRPHVLEFEFPELPLENRYLRVGTDPRGMVQPLQMVMEAIQQVEREREMDVEEN